MVFSKKTDTPGGHAIKHHCDLRLEIVPVKFLSEEKAIAGKKYKQEYGVISNIKVVKSSVWKPHQIAPIYVVYDYGIDDIRANLQFIKDYTTATTYWTDDRSMKDAIDNVEENNLENDLKEATINLWEEIQEKFHHDRKPKKRRI